MEPTIDQLMESLKKSLEVLGEMPESMCLCCQEQFSKDNYDKLKTISQEVYGHSGRMLQRHFFQKELIKLMPEKLNEGERLIGFKLKDGNIIAEVARAVTL